jgi:hypothetical protein
MAWYEIKARDIAGGTWEITVKPDGRSVQIPDDVAATVVLYQLYYDEEGPGELDG